MRPRISVRGVVIGVVLVGGALFAVAAMRGLGEGSVYYYTPSEVPRPTGEEVIRVGGTVVPGSVSFGERSGVLRFALTDGEARLRVANRGAPPDLFRAGREALVEGRVTAGVLRSSDVIVKHDEGYSSAASAEEDVDR